jgi:hypothetical protein
MWTHAAWTFSRPARAGAFALGLVLAGQVLGIGSLGSSGWLKAGFAGRLDGDVPPRIASVGDERYWLEQAGRVMTPAAHPAPVDPAPAYAVGQTFVLSTPGAPSRRFEVVAVQPWTASPADAARPGQLVSARDRATGALIRLLVEAPSPTAIDKSL